MSKLISTEEIMATHNEERGLLQGERRVAKAQRDSSDREWIHSLEHSVWSIDHAGLPEIAEIHFKMPLKKWQALKQKED